MESLRWILEHFIYAMAALILVAYAEWYWASHGLPRWRRVLSFFLMTALLAYPVYITVWLGGLPPTNPLRAPAPEETLTCFTTTFLNVPGNPPPVVKCHLTVYPEAK